MRVRMTTVGRTAIAFLLCLELAFAFLLVGAMRPAYADTPDSDGLVINTTAYIKGPPWGIEEERSVPFLFDYHWLTTNCLAKYNNKLATFANLLALNAYGDSYSSLTSGVDPADNEALLKSMGLRDVHEYAFIGKDAAYDKNDQTSVTLGHRLVTIDGMKYDVYLCAIDGTDGDESGSEAQWSSNFDIGADTDDYYSQTGQHPEWKNTDETKGISIASERSQAVIDAYLAENGTDADAQKCLLICGHSRGGAIANILGACYERDASVNSCAYSFSSPLTNTEDEADRTAYQTLFTHVAQSDFFAQVPLPTWDFGYYGREIRVDVGSSEAVAKSFAALTGHDFEVAYPEGVVEALTDGISSREALCEMRTETLEYDEDTMEALTQAISYFEGYGIQGLSAVRNPQDPSEIILQSSYIPFTTGLSLILANRDNFEKVLGIIDQMIWFLGDLRIGRIALEALAANPVGFVDAHCGASTYSIALNQPSDPDLGHVHMLVNAKEATDDENGYTGDTVCEECGLLLKAGEVIPALKAPEDEESPLSDPSGSSEGNAGGDESVVVGSAPSTGDSPVRAFAAFAVCALAVAAAGVSRKLAKR